MYQPVASNLTKNPLMRIGKDALFSLKAKWWSWSNQTEKTLEYWRYRFQVNSPSQKLKLADQLIAYQSYDEVLSYVETIPQDERTPEIIGLLARCLYGKGQIQRALTEVEAALEESLDSSLLELHSDCLLEMGRWKEAITSLEKALRISPNRVEAVYRLGTIYLYHSEQREALRCFQGCCNLDPRNPLYWEMKAETHLELGQFLDAIKSFKRALRLGIDAELHARIAYCYVKVDDLKSGIKHYRKALSYDPDNYDALCNLAAIFQHTGKSLDALNLLERAYELNANDPVVLNNLAFTMVHLGRSRKAIEIYKKALELNPNSPILLYNLGICYAEKGIWEEAIKTINLLLAIEPNHSEGLILLGNVYEKLSKYEEAIDCFNSALGLA